MVSEHSYKEYDIELEAVRAQLLKMGGLVEENILLAIESLKKDDVELANKVIKTDEAVNKLEMEIDEAAKKIRRSKDKPLPENTEETKEETKLKDSIIVEEPPGNYKKISPEIIKMMTNSKKY